MQDWNQIFSEAEVLLLLTGAGMGADSGIPTYRGEGGTWGVVQDEWQKNITEIMNPDFIAQHPIYMWQRFAKRIEFFENVQPHKGYDLINKWIKAFSWKSFAVSSNIDGQLQKTQFDADKVLEVHGSIHYLQCSVPCRQEYWQEKILLDYSRNDLTISELPRCPYCGELSRPNVLLFKDNTFVRKRSHEQKSNFETFLQINRSKKILVLEIGAGIHVKTIRYLSMRIMREFEAKVVRINPNDYEIDHPHLGLPMTALEGLKKMDQQLTT